MASSRSLQQWILLGRWGEMIRVGNRENVLRLFENNAIMTCSAVPTLAMSISSNYKVKPSCKTVGRLDLAILYLSLLWYTTKDFWLPKTYSLAALNRDDIFFKFLLTHGAGPNFTDEHHRTAVSLSSRPSFLPTSPSLSLLLRCKSR